MDAREFEPDDPLPQTCQHCKWAKLEPDDVGLGMTLTCSQPLTVLSLGLAEFRRLGRVLGRSRMPMTQPDHTCKHWEERE